MGSGLADDITQGLATGDMFRTTPLCGIGQRRFVLHDGRTSDLLVAIRAHFSAASECDGFAASSTGFGPTVLWAFGSGYGDHPL